MVACGGVVAIQVERLTAKWQQGAGDFQSVFSEHKKSTYARTGLVGLCGQSRMFRFGTFEQVVQD